MHVCKGFKNINISYR
jgi:hypothetical protein